MATTRQQSGEVFGVLHAFTLGTILFVGACIAPFLDMLHINIAPLTNKTVDLALWIGEAVLYLVLGVVFARKPLGAVLGLLLGFGTRIAAITLMFLLMGAPFAAIFTVSTYGLSHLIAVIIALLALSLSFRTMLTKLGTKPPIAPAAAKSKVRYSFDNTPPPAKSPSQARVPLVLSATGTMGNMDEGETPATHLQPPADFSPVYPKDDVFGTVNIPASVILASVPEAKLILSPGYSIPVRVAYFVPQLPRATAWLTWKQVFEKGVPPMQNVDTARLEPEFYSRWIRIPAKYYALQVPQEYFKTKKVPPAWMRLPEVEQEADISFSA